MTKNSKPEDKGKKQKLSNKIEHAEGKYVYSAHRRISLRPKSSRTVQMENGNFAQVDQPAVAIEMADGEIRSRKYDPNDPKDAEALELLEQLLEERPEYRTDIRFKIQIVGEHEAKMPWPGYDDQTANDVEVTYNALPTAARPDLNQVMKYELDKGDKRDKEKVELLNRLHNLEDQDAKANANVKVDLS